MTNIEFVQVDAFDTGLPRESFDLVHVRFLFSPLGRDEALMQELLRLLVLEEFWPRGGGRMQLHLLSAAGGLGAVEEANGCRIRARWWRRQCRTTITGCCGRQGFRMSRRGGPGSTGWTSIQAVATGVHHRHAATNQGVRPHVSSLVGLLG